MNFEKGSQLYNHSHNQDSKYFPHSKIFYAFVSSALFFTPDSHPARPWQPLAFFYLHFELWEKIGKMKQFAPNHVACKSLRELQIEITALSTTVFTYSHKICRIK